MQMVGNSGTRLTVYKPSSYIYPAARAQLPQACANMANPKRNAIKCKCMNAFGHAQMLTSLLSAEKLIFLLATICRSPTGFRGDPYHLGNARKCKCITCSRISANIQVCLPLQVHCMLSMPSPATAALRK